MIDNLKTIIKQRIASIEKNLSQYDGSTELTTFELFNKHQLLGGQIELQYLMGLIDDINSVWISVKDQLPKEGQRVNIYYNPHAFKQVEKIIRYDVEYYYEEKYDMWFFGGWSVENVSHWLPVLQIPNEIEF